MKQTYYRICSNCGNQNAADANFCLKCGTTLSAADELRPDSPRCRPNVSAVRPGTNAR